MSTVPPVPPPAGTMPHGPGQRPAGEGQGRAGHRSASDSPPSADGSARPAPISGAAGGAAGAVRGGPASPPGTSNAPPAATSGTPARSEADPAAPSSRAAGPRAGGAAQTAGPAPRQPASAVTIGRGAMGPPLQAVLEPATAPGVRLALSVRIIAPLPIAEAASGAPLGAASGPAARALVSAAAAAAAAAPGAAAAGLVAAVRGRAGDGGLVLDLGGHRLTLLPQRPAPGPSPGPSLGRAGGPSMAPKGGGTAEAMLPVGARLLLQLLAPGSPAPVDDRAGLDRLLDGLLRLAGKGSVEAAGDRAMADARAASLARAAAPLAADATLAARLLTDWQSLAMRRGREPTGPGGGGRRGDGGQEIAVEGGKVLVRDAETGWRGLFGMLADPGEVAAPLAAWRRERGDDAADDRGIGHEEATEADENAQRLLFTLDLSRLGRTVIDLRVDRRQLRVVVVSAAPLPEALRRALAEPFAAAAELAGRTGSLVFRRARPATVAPAPGVPRGWTG